MLLVGLSPAVSSFALFAKAGPAHVRHDSNIAPGSTVGLRLDMDDYFYDGDFDGSDKFHHDLVIGAGVAFGFSAARPSGLPSCRKYS